MGNEFKHTNAFIKQVQAYTKRVNLGTRYLNKTKPGWYKKIDLEILDLGSPHSCILGQTFNQFWNKVNEDDEHARGKMSGTQSEKRGFRLTSTDPGKDNALGYDLLTKVWVAKIYTLIGN